jgi:hypothetical protein
MLDGEQNGFNRSHRMESNKGEYDKPPLTCFGHPQGWATLKNTIAIQLSKFLRWRPRFFNRQKKWHAIFLTSLSKLSQNIWQSPFVVTKTIQSLNKK